MVALITCLGLIALYFGVHSLNELSPPTTWSRWGIRIAELESSVAELKAERDRPVDVQEALSLHGDLSKKAPKPRLLPPTSSPCAVMLRTAMISKATVDLENCPFDAC